MRSTNLSESVTASSLADDLTDLLLQPRRIYLKKKQPRWAYVVDLRKKLQAKVATPFRMLLSVSFADLNDGIALPMVRRPYEVALALLDEHAASIAPRPTAPFQTRLAAVMQRETKAQGVLDQAQLRVMANPTDRIACLEMERAIVEYEAVLADMKALISERCAQDRALVA